MHQSEFPNKATSLCYSWLMEDPATNIVDQFQIELDELMSKLVQMKETWSEFIHDREQLLEFMLLSPDCEVDVPRPPDSEEQLSEFMECFYDTLGNNIRGKIFTKIQEQTGNGLSTLIFVLFQGRENDIDHAGLAKRIVSEQFPEMLVELQRFTLADCTA